MGNLISYLNGGNEVKLSRVQDWYMTQFRRSGVQKFLNNAELKEFEVSIPKKPIRVGLPSLLKNSKYIQYLVKDKLLIPRGQYCGSLILGPTLTKF